MPLVAALNKLLTGGGLVWGVYQSFKVLKLHPELSRGSGRVIKPDGGSESEDEGKQEGKQSDAEAFAAQGPAMLMYWLLFSTIAVYDKYLEYFVHWLPFYFEMKCLFLIAVLAPQLKLPQYLFEVFMKPFVETYGNRWAQHWGPRVFTRLSQMTRKLQEFVFGSTSRSVPPEELKHWEGSLRKQLAVVRAERARRSSGAAVDYGQEEK